MSAVVATVLFMMRPALSVAAEVVAARRARHVAVIVGLGQAAARGVYTDTRILIVALPCPLSSPTRMQSGAFR